MKQGDCVCPLSCGAYTATLYVMVTIVKGVGRAPPPLPAWANFPSFPTSYSFCSALLYTVKEKGGKPDRKPHPLPRNLYRNLKSENSQLDTQEDNRLHGKDNQ